MSKLKEKLMLSEKGYSDLKKAITACTITNIALLLPSMVACLLFWAVSYTHLTLPTTPYV